MSRSQETLHVSLVAIPEATVSSIGGMYDVLEFAHVAAGFDRVIGKKPPFAVEIVGSAAGPMMLASGLPLPVHRAIAEVRHTDIVIVPSLLVADGAWRKGRYDELVTWLRAMHRAGATICSACSGVFLIAETGLFDGRETTIHWSYAHSFRRCYPDMRVHPEKVLVSSWQVGYEDPAFFRRLFRRITQLSPGDYRKRFAVPAVERAAS